MPSKFDQYRVRTGDPIGDPAYWNDPRLKDIDTRITGLEAQKANLDAVIEEGRTAFRTRVDEILVPLVREVADITQVGVMLRAHSATPVSISTGGKTLVIDAAEAARFAAPAYVSVIAAGDPARAMYATVLSYDRATGELVIDVERVIGAGSGGDWIVTIANTTDAAQDAVIASAAATDALGARNQVEAMAVAAEAAAGTAAQMRDSAVAANTQAQGHALAAQDYLDDVSGAIAQWQAAVLPPSETAPTTRPGGGALQVGDQYFKPSLGYWLTWDGAQWTVNVVPVGSEVASVFGRTGTVSAQAGDYRSDQVARSSSQQAIVAGATVEAALATLNGGLQSANASIAQVSASKLDAASAPAAIRTALNIKGMASQEPSAVAITGGAIAAAVVHDDGVF